MYTTISPTILNDAFCDCPGYQFNGGKCSHTQAAYDNECGWMLSPAEDYQESLVCPLCGAPAEDFETESEFL